MSIDEEFKRKGEVMAKPKLKKRIMVDLQGDDLQRFEEFKERERREHNADADATVLRKLALLGLDRKLRTRATG